MAAILQILRLRGQGLNIALGSSFPQDETLLEYKETDLSYINEATAKNRYFQEAFQILKYKDRFKNVIVLNGNVHSTNHLRFYDKMKLDIPYMGFIQAYGGGTEWNCQSAAGGGYELFDGVFAFKTITASSPYQDDLTSN